VAQVEKDAEFFKANSIIDYSLLLGVHYPDRIEEMNRDSYFKDQNRQPNKIKAEIMSGTSVLNVFQKTQGGWLSGDGSKIYFLGIIDIFTEFNSFKKFEHGFKRIRYGKGISCIPPADYAARFENFLKNQTEKVDTMNERVLTQPGRLESDLIVMNEISLKLEPTRKVGLREENPKADE